MQQHDEKVIESSSFHSDDLAPIPQEKQTWNTGNYAAWWVSMSLCIPTYMLASSLIGGGMNWWEAIITIFLGNAIVLISMVLNGHAGAKYGTPFPVFCAGKLWGKRSKHRCHAESHRGLRLVWYTNRDRRFCNLPDVTVMDTRN